MSNILETVAKQRFHGVTPNIHENEQVYISVNTAYMRAPRHLHTWPGSLFE